MADQAALRNKGEHGVHVLTVGGDIALIRRYFWSKGCGGQYPVDAIIGIEGGTVSPGALQLCCTMGVIQDFAQGADDLHTFSGLRVSKERLRQITESQGREAARVRESGALKPAWSAAEATAGFGEPTRVYVGADGVMVRIVTQEEKDKRRQEQVIRRQQRGRAGVGNTRPLPKPRPGSDERFKACLEPRKEMKIGLFYDQSKTRVHAFATAGDHEAFGMLLRLHAHAIALEQATETLSLTDGGPWIRNQILKHLQKLNAIPSRLRTRLLDFFHFSEHIWSTARCCLGDGPEARTWAEKQLHEIKHIGGRTVLAAIEELGKKIRSPSKKESLRRLRRYLVERWEHALSLEGMVEYPQALARGWDIGSGPTEAIPSRLRTWCKNLTLRLKRTGMKHVLSREGWDADHAADLMNLVALRESGQWAVYWDTRRIA